MRCLCLVFSKLCCYSLLLQKLLTKLLGVILVMENIDNFIEKYENIYNVLRQLHSRILSDYKLKKMVENYAASDLKLINEEIKNVSLTTIDAIQFIAVVG